MRRSSEFGVRSSESRVVAIVPAAGAGRRLGTRESKLFVELGGRPLLAHTLRALQLSPLVTAIVIVVREQDRERTRELLRRERITKALAPCLGGPSRADSVTRGLAAAPEDAAWILVHDGARPCLTRPLVEQALRAARRWGAVACGLPASLTVKAVDGEQAVRLTLDREHLWLAQTPQVFRRDWFQQALAAVNGRLGRFPDDVSILESAGFPVRMIPGDPLNIKVTTREDLVLAQAILRAKHASRDRLRQPSV